MLPIEKVTYAGCRYDSQIEVYSSTMQESISTLNMFLGGSGRNRMQKMMGTCGSGVTHITDMTWFRKAITVTNVHSEIKIHTNPPKSLTATRAANAINLQFCVKAYEMKVHPDSKLVFNDNCYDFLRFVCTALDNVKAKCIFYHVPMLESGTLGTNTHTQVFVPRLTTELWLKNGRIWVWIYQPGIYWLHLMCQWLWQYHCFKSWHWLNILWV